MNNFVTQLRCPESLVQAVKAAAAENGRSMNAEIVVRLRASLTQDTTHEGRAA
jgi:hypothetical protein